MYPQHMFSCSNKKNIYVISLLIWSYGTQNIYFLWINMKTIYLGTFLMNNYVTIFGAKVIQNHLSGTLFMSFLTLERLWDTFLCGICDLYFIIAADMRG